MELEEAKKIVREVHEVVNLRDQRENIIRVLAIALDSCIKSIEERGDPSPVHFEGEIKFLFAGEKDALCSRPALDFTKDIEPQLEPKVWVVP